MKAEVTRISADNETQLITHWLWSVHPQYAFGNDQITPESLKNKPLKLTFLKQTHSLHGKFGLFAKV